MRYLTLFNRLFSPAEDLNVPELSDSMLSWIPKAQAMSAIRTYQKIMDDNFIHQGLPRSQTYYNILVHEIANLTTLNANEDAKKNLIGAAGFQTLNIVGDDLNVQAEYQVNYGQPKNNRPQIPHNADPKKYTVMQRDQSGIKKQNDIAPTKQNNQKEEVCFLCNKNHFTHRCLLTRQIRDGKFKPPQNFCQKHCGKVFDLCGKNKCYIIHSKSGKSYNLTCKKPDHGTKHFLLCPSEGCRKASEKWWKKQN